MRSPKRAIVAIIAVVLGAASLTGCLSPPVEVGAGAYCSGKSFTGEHTRTVPNIGTLTFRSRICMNNLTWTFSRDGSVCTAPNGYTSTPRVSATGRGHGGPFSTYTATLRASCEFENGFVSETHRHSLTGAAEVHTYCYTTFCADGAEQLPPARGGTTPPPTTPTTPPAPRHVSGSIVPVSMNVQLKLNGAAIATSNGAFNKPLPNAFPTQNSLTLTAPAGYSVFYTACSNRTNCHDSKTPTLGDTATANPDDGGYLDVKWYVRRNGTIQGFKMIEHVGGSVGMPAVVAMKIWLDGNLVADNVNPYVLSNISPGRHKIRAERPAGWDLGYTLCYNSISCHDDWPHGWIYPPSNNEVTIDVPVGGFVDLYWHYYQQ